MDKEIKDNLDKIKKLTKETEGSLDSLTQMIEDPEKYFEDNPIKEDWQDPPEFPTLKEYDRAFEESTPILEQIKMFARISAISHFQKRKTKEHNLFEVVTNHSKKNELEEIIAVKLRKQGYEVQTQSNVDKWNSMKDNHIHFGIGEGICLHEIPRIKECNLEVTNYIVDKKGNIRNYDELVKVYQEKNAPEPTDFEELTEDLDDTKKKMVKEFMEDEKLTCEDISSIEENYDGDGLLVDIGNRQYTIMQSEDVAEQVAFAQIDDDSEMEYFWREKIKSDEGYTGGLEQFIQDVKDDGWVYQLSRYDHNYEVTKSNFVYFRED